jgi:DNA-binding NarL/FixJ family response regulator
VILIEIQKSKFESDIVRFRKYLGKQYQSAQNNFSDNPNKAIPIHTIYFLGEGLAHFKNSPIINVTRQCIDNFTKEILPEKDDFVECLTHDSVVVQLDVLKGHRRNRLEKILSIFDASTQQILEIEDDKSDPDFAHLIRRLVGAYSSNELLEQMDLEDQIVNELKSKERIIEETRQIAEEALKNEAKALKNETEALKQKEEEQRQKKEAILFMLSLGVDKFMIAQKLGISVEQIEHLL